MKINIKLTRETTPRLTEPFTVKEDKNILLSFITDYELKTAKITLTNGDITDTFNFEKDFIVPDKFMFVGRLFIYVEMFVGDKSVKKWEILPISIERTNTGLKIFDYLSSIEERLKVVERYQEIT